MPPGTNQAVQALAKTTTGATLAELRSRVTPSMIADCLKGALDATSWVKDGGEVPNWTARMQACTLLLNYFEGKPIERQEIITKDITESDEERHARLMRSPAARAHLQRMLDAANAADATDTVSVEITVGDTNQDTSEDE